MPKTINNDQRAQDDLRESDATTNQESETSEYAVGRCRPPMETRFKKGKSGNPTGRRKGRRNVNSELEEIARRKVKIRDGDKEREMSLLAAKFLCPCHKGRKRRYSLGRFSLQPRRAGGIDELRRRCRQRPLARAHRWCRSRTQLSDSKQRLVRESRRERS